MDGLYSPKVPEPEYPPITDSYEEWKRWLDLKFLWYPLDVLDTFGSHAFNGVISFLYMVRGIGESKRDQKAYPTRVLRIKHPEDPGNRISYAILVEGYGLISDYSGGIIFYELGTDSSGTGGSWFRAAESILEQYKNVFEVEEITVTGEIFEKYLADRAPDRFSEDILMKFESIEKDNLKYQENMELLKRLMADFRGILPELLVYYLVSSGRLYPESGSTKEWKNVEWNIKVSGEQIDVFAVDDTNKPWIFECKFDVHQEEVEDTINQILRKRDAIINEYKIEPVTNLVFLRNRNNYSLAPFEDRGIHVIVLEPILRGLLPEKNLDVIRKIIKSE